MSKQYKEKMKANLTKMYWTDISISSNKKKTRGLENCFLLVLLKHVPTRLSSVETFKQTYTNTVINWLVKSIHICKF